VSKIFQSLSIYLSIFISGKCVSVYIRNSEPANQTIVIIKEIAKNIGTREPFSW
jgi:hypothetical protein